MTLIKVGPGVFIKETAVVVGTHVVVLAEIVNGQYREEDVLLETKLEPWVINVRGVNSLRRYTIHSQLYKNGKHVLVLKQKFSTFNVSYVNRSRLDSQET